jgi:serine/threonine protein kinase
MRWILRYQILVWLEFSESMNLKQTQAGSWERSKLIIINNVSSLFVPSMSLITCNGFCSGYVPPEYVRKGIYSPKYDVYSFGVLLLQIISGNRTSRYYGPHENICKLSISSLLRKVFLMTCDKISHFCFFY